MIAAEAARPTHEPLHFESSMLDAIVDTMLLRGGYNTNVVLVAVCLFGATAAIVGSFAMLKKQSLVADAFAHASLVGVASAFLIHATIGMEERSVPVLLVGAAASGALAVHAIQWLTTRTRLRADTATATVSSASFGAGIVALSIVRRTEGADQAGLDGLIFGAAASMTRSDAWIMASIAAVTLVAITLLSRSLTAVAFNERYARTSGLPVGLVDALLGALVGVITIAGLQAVGMLLVVALLAIPAAAARLWVRRVGALTALAGVFGAVSGWVGVSISGAVPGAPTGSLVVLVAASVFSVSFVASPTRGLVAGALARRRVRARARRVAAEGASDA